MRPIPEIVHRDSPIREAAVFYCHEATQLSDAADFMKSGGLDRLLVVSDGQLLSGVIDWADIANRAAEQETDLIWGKARKEQPASVEFADQTSGYAQGIGSGVQKVYATNPIVRNSRTGCPGSKPSRQEIKC